MKLTVKRVGRSLGVTLSREAAQALGVHDGDALFLTDAPGGFRLTREDPGSEESTGVAEDFLSRYASALRKISR
jgi:putative addiction module antidote